MTHSHTTIAAVLGLCLTAAGQNPAAPKPHYLAVSAVGDSNVTLYELRGPRTRAPKAIPVGKSPTEMCLSPDNNRLYVSDASNKNVAVIDVKSQAVVGALTDAAMKSPDGCIVSPDSKRLYSIDQQANAVFVFSTENNALLKQIPVGDEPRRAIFTLDNKRMLVSNAHSDSLSVIDVATNAVVQTIKTPGHEPRQMAWSPDGKFLAVTIIEDDSVDFFKADTLEFDQQVAGPVSSQRLWFAPDGKLLFVLGRYEKLHVLDLRTDFPAVGNRRLGTSIDVPFGAWSMTASNDGNYLFITQPGATSQIAVVDVRLMKVINTFSGPKGVRDVVYIP